jgi:dephospho-CoA kinase
MRVGVTGGIGSGKTTVCRIFGVLGIPVFDADSEAQTIIGCNLAVQKRLSDIAGTDLFSSGSLDRKKLAGLIFNNPKMLKKVNDLIHPLVFSKFDTWASDKSSPYVIMEAAILFESGAWELVDRSITVVAPEEERMLRVTGRSNISANDIAARIRNQISDEERVRQSDYTINNADSEMIIPAVIRIHEHLLSQIVT